MSYFGETLKRLLDEKGQTMTQLSQASGVGLSSLSRLINGEQSYVSPEDLAAISRSISHEPKVQAEILRAHLLDECRGPGSSLIEISINGGRELREDEVQYGRKIKLSPELREAVAYLAALAPENEHLRALLIQLADAFKPKA